MSEHFDLVNDVEIVREGEKGSDVKQAIIDGLLGVDEEMEATKNYQDRLLNLLYNDTVSGELVTVNNSAELPLQSVKIEGTTSQNLFIKLDSKKQNGVTFTINDDGSCKLSGTATVWAGTYKTNQPLGAIRTGSTLCIPSVSTDGYGYYIDFYDSDGNNIGGLSSRGNKIYKVPSNATHISFGIEVLSNTTVNTTIYPMLVEGTEPKPFTPCAKITSVEGAVEVEVCGKNLWGYTQADVNEWLYKNASYIKTLKLLPNTAYTMSSNAGKNNTGGATLWFGGDTTVNAGVWGGNPRTVITGDSGEVICYVNAATANKLDSTVWIQLELGSEATAYEPYQGTTTTITLPDGEFMGRLPDGTCDYIEVSDGVGTLYKRTQIKTITSGNVYSISTSTTPHYCTLSGIMSGLANWTTLENANNDKYSSTVLCDKVSVNNSTNKLRCARTWNGFYFYGPFIESAEQMQEYFDSIFPFTIMLDGPSRTVSLGPVDLPDGIYGTTNVYATNDQNLSQTVEITYISDYATAFERIEESLRDVNNYN